MKSRFFFSSIFILFSFFYLTPLFAQTESKIVVITVSGTGKTQDEAKQNALRNAIEQAFGTFISSNTQILNDELVKDEIVSVSSGNIQDYTVLSEVQTPDGFWSNTVKAKVAIDKLTSFCESKGVNVEFKGSLFSLNIKQQELNEKSEEKAIENMCVVLKELSEKCFDYEIQANEPVTSFYKKGYWDIPIIIYAIPNENIKIISKYFIETLTGLSLSNSEISSYEKLGKKINHVEILIDLDKDINAVTQPKNKKEKNQPFVQEQQEKLLKIGLRSRNSLGYIFDFLGYFRKTLLNFKITNELDEKLGNSFFYTNYQGYINCKLQVEDNGFKPSIQDYYHDNGPSVILGYPFTESRGNLYPYEVKSFSEGNNFFENNTIILKALPIGVKCIKMTYTDTMSIEEISKISTYKITYCNNSYKN